MALVLPVAGSAQSAVRGERVQVQGGGSLPIGNTTRLAGNDDGSTGRVPIGFTLNFFGNTYDHLWVNNNGNVTFGRALSQFTPRNLTGPTDNPIIAAFFADVDTRSVASRNFVDASGNPVARPLGVGYTSYGSYTAASSFGQLFNPGGPGTGPGHNVFSATWSDVGFYSNRTHRTNTFQLNLIDRDETAPGFGNFDIELNYEQIQWEAGTASGGSTNGLGGVSAAVGYSAGSGAPGTFTQLNGSLVNGALIDGGSSSLRDGAFFSSQPGRYLFQIRNSGTGLPGATPGTALIPTVINPGDPSAGIAPAFIFRNAPSGLWFDPPFTDAYIYEANDANTLFTGLTLPTLGDNLFDICWGVSFGTCQLGWSGMVQFNFPTTQSLFRVSGIDPTRDVQDPNAFPTQLFFQNPTGNNFTMSPVLPAATVPEPQTWVLLGAGLVGLYGVRRRTAGARVA